MNYNPHNWVVLKIDLINEPVFYKVLAGWSGSYLEGSYWRLNSGITSCTLDGDYYVFQGLSGSEYRCHRETYKIKANIGSVYDLLKDRYDVTVELMPEETDWLNLDYKKGAGP